MINMNDLKPCPFCEGEAELKEARTYGTTGWRVMCKDCRIGTLPVWINLPIVMGSGKVDEATRYTSDQAKQIVIEKWNRRP